MKLIKINKLDGETLKELVSFLNTIYMSTDMLTTLSPQSCRNRNFFGSEVDLEPNPSGIKYFIGRLTKKDRDTNLYLLMDKNDFIGIYGVMIQNFIVQTFPRFQGKGLAKKYLYEVIELIKESRPEYDYLLLLHLKSNKKTPQLFNHVVDEGLSKYQTLDTHDYHGRDVSTYYLPIDCFVDPFSDNSVLVKDSDLVGGEYDRC